MVSALKTDSSLDPVTEAEYLMGAVPELMQFYYAQENRGEQAVEDAIATGALPDVQVDEAPVILMAKWTKHPGHGIGRNKPPVADTGLDQNVFVGDSVQLNGSSSYDADGNSLAYRWLLTSKPAGSSAMLVNATTVNPTFVADAAGTYQISLVVNDGTLDSGSSVVTIIAANGNIPPVAKAGSNQQVLAGDLATLDGSASTDADGDTLTYRWEFISRPAGSNAALSNPAAASPTFATDMIGNYVISLVVNDGQADSGISQVTVAAIQGNLQPVANAGTAKNVLVGNQITLDGRGSTDPDGDPLTYKWSFASKPAGSAAALSNSASAQPFFVADVGGTYVVSLIVKDGQVDSKPANVSIVATAPVVVQPTPAPAPTPAPTAYEAPVLESVEINGTSWILDWSQPGDVPGGGYDIWIDGVDTGSNNRTNQLNTVISGLTAGVQHCFEIEGRFMQATPAQYFPSNKVCASPAVDATPIPAPAPATSPIPTGALKGIPGSIGFGTSTSGGRGGVIIRVNTLADNNNALTANADGTLSGSLRSALNYNGKRIVVFEVSGRIDLSSELVISHPYITIAGQTAPPPGVTLYANGLRIGTHDVVVENIRSRPNNNTSNQTNGALVIQDYNNDIYNVVVDRSSFGWGADETLCIWASYQNGRTISDVTISNSIIHESIHPPAQAYYGFIIGDRVKRVSAIGNLLVSNGERNPLYKGGSEAIWANNISYNISSGAFVLFADDYSSNGAKASIIGNIFKKGPSGSPSAMAWFNGNTAGKGFQIYQSDNIYKNQSGAVSSMVFQNTAPSGAMVSSPPVWIDGLPLLTSGNLEASVLSKVGARAKERGTSNQDANDVRVINDYKSGTGAVPVAGYYFPAPIIAGQKRPFIVPANPNSDPDGNGYTKIEEVLYQMALEVQ